MGAWERFPAQDRPWWVASLQQVWKSNRGVSQARHLFSVEQAVSVCEREEPNMLWAGPPVEVLF